ncbi:MAG: choloylglycine hydrolase family protein [Nitratireductor sp.]|nr:choloylglycine hydrolase family protein [Nitratireductor sp.]
MLRKLPNLLNRATAILLAGAMSLTPISLAQACTGIRLIAEDGTVVHARTLEFGLDLESDVLVIPRGFERTGITPDGAPGLVYKSKYASVGANGVGLPYLFDGVNEKGLAVGTFYFPTTAGYMPYAPADAARTLAPWQVGSWILENFANVQEVRDNIASIVVPEVIYPDWGFAPPVHYVVHDETGTSIVIEYVGGKLNVHDNPLGVMSNSPSFDWHMTNLRNYVNMSVNNAPPAKIGSVTLLPLGMGSGMLGVPGDFTPPSRFVRAAIYSASALPSATSDEAVNQAFHILNQFDIPKGAARDHEKDEHGNVVADYTLWTSANDLKNRRFFIRTYDNSQIRSIDLMSQDLDAKEIATFKIDGKETFVPLTK